MPDDYSITKERMIPRAHCWILLGAILSWVAVPHILGQHGQADWPRFRGPDGLGISQSKGVPLTWNATNHILWKTALPGPGTSSPIIVGGKIFLTCYTGFNVPGQNGADMQQLKLHVVCLDRDTGQITWSVDVAPRLPEQAKIREDHGYASSTPVADGERVYVFFGKSGVLAYAHDGQQVWRADVGSELSGWGSAASPVLWGDLLLVNASVESQSLVALDKLSGKEKWRAGGIIEAWNTPLLVSVPSGKQELVVPMPRKVAGFDPATGESLWHCANDIQWYIAPSAVTQDGVIWSIGGRSGVAAVAVRAGGRGDVTSTHRLWTSSKGSNVSSPLVHEGHLYWAHENLGVAYCANASSGTVVYEERLPRAGQVYASPVLADGRIYYLSRGGRAYVLPAAPRFEVLAVNELGDQGTFNASPAVSGNRLFLRSDRFLYCVGE